jgi:hypothetical protein
MESATLTTRILRQGLSNQVRPLDAPSLPWRNPAIVRAAERSTVRVEQTLANSVANRARPFPFTAASRAEAAFTTNRINASAARAAAASLAEKQAGAALGRQFLVFRARSAVGAVLAPAARASAAVSGALMRTPVVGTVIRRLAPFVPKGPGLGVLIALQVVPSIFEVFAPDVKKWLLGGWSQSGYKQNQLPPGVGQSAVRYNLQFVVAELYNGQLYPPGGTLDRANGIMGPIGEVKAPREPGVGANVFIFSPTGVRIGNGNNGYGTGVYRILSISVVREDGAPENGVPFSVTGTSARPPVKVIPSKTSNPAWTNNAKNARDAAIAAAAVTIAAGKFKLPPKLKRPPTQIPARKVGILPSASPTTPQPSRRPCQGNSCGQAGLDQATKNGEDIQKILDALSLLGIGDIKKTVDRIDTKIGPQITDAVGNKRGLTDMAVDTFKKVNKVGDYLRFDRITNVLNLAVTLHNAAMLSNNLSQTLMSAIGNGLDAIGIDDDAGNALNIQEIVGKTTENIVKGAIGAENYAALTINWKKANRIYQASANLLNNLQSLRYSITGALETIGGMNAKVGNALKKYGVLGDNAYPWFNPSPNYDNKFMRRLEVAETTVSSIDSVASEILSAQDSVKQIGEQKTELEKAIKEGTEKPGVDNTQQKEKAAATKTASKSPDIVSDNLIKPES